MNFKTLFWICIASTLLNACSSTPPSQVVHEAQLQENSSGDMLLLLDSEPNPIHAPLYLGIEKRFFSARGIDIKIKKTNYLMEPIFAVRDGKVAMAISTMPEVILSIAHGTPIETIGLLVKQPLNALIYRKDENIQNHDDLSGKKLGYCIDNPEAYLLEPMLSDAHIVPKEKNKDCTDLVSSLASKKVDVIYGAYKNLAIPQLKSLKADSEFIDLVDIGLPTYYELIIIAKSNTLQTSQDFKDKFYSALQECIDYSVGHPEEAFQAYLNANPEKKEKAHQWEKDAWTLTIPLLAKDQANKDKVWDDFSSWITLHNIYQ